MVVNDAVVLCGGSDVMVNVVVVVGGDVVVVCRGGDGF